MSDASPENTTAPDPPIADINAMIEEVQPSVEDVQRLDVRRQQQKRAFFLDNLIRNLDIMVYCELSILYYMDCSLIHFLIRAVPQWVYFTPKPAYFPVPAINRPYAAIILGTNILCIIIHCFSDTPAGSEELRGYLHGGVFVDFVGELGPVSRLKMVLYDLLTLLLQLLVLNVVDERRKLRLIMQDPLSGLRGVVQRVGELLRTVGVTTPDLEAAEAGLPRVRGNDIEMQDFEEESHDPLLETMAEPRAQPEHPLDPFSTGRYVVANLNVFDTIRASLFYTP
jgi:hypothetical protein